MKILGFAALITPLVLLGLAINANAAPINSNTNRNYDRQGEYRNTNDIYGVKTVLTGGWNSLQPGSLAASGSPFPAIQKDMWAVFSENSNQTDTFYIEILNQSNNTATSFVTQAQAAGRAQAVAPSYKGYVIATEQYDKFSPSVTFGQTVQKSIVYGGNGTGAAQTGGTLELTQAGPPGQWQAKINNTIVSDQNLTCVRTLSNGTKQPYVALPARIIQVGIESNDTTNTFTKGTKMSFTRRVGTGVYTPVPAASAQVVPGENNVGWTSTYDATTGEVTFNRP